MKKFLTSVVFVLAIIAGLCAFAACGKGESAQAISVKDENKPQTTYVLGHDLDFSEGLLTVDYGGRTEDIPMNDSAISVEGYDKDKLGKQDLTLGYGGCTTTLSVTVVKRMTSDGIDLKYFVGDDINRDTGKIRITRDNGKSFSTDFSDAKFSVSGFDTSTAGAKSMSVNYADGSETYTDSFDITVYEVGSMTFQHPTKIVYQSHLGLDLSGGRITKKSADGTFTKQMPLTEDMISGFDLSVAGLNNRTAATAAKQRLTVTYGGQSWPYDIDIIFSDVSYIRYVYGEIEDIDINATDSIPGAEGTLSIEAMKCYLGLSDDDKTYLTDEQIDQVARVSVLCGLDLWTKELAKYNKTFVMEKSQFSFVESTTYAQTKDDYDALNDDDNVFYAYSDFLAAILADSRLSGLQLFSDSDNKISAYLANVLPSSAFKSLSLPMMDFLLQLYERVAKNVREDWSAADISPTNVNLYEAYALIRAKLNNQSTFTLYSNRNLYGVLSTWREDYFDIFYTYLDKFYKEAVKSENTGDINAAIDRLYQLANFCHLPEELEGGIYPLIFSARRQLDMLPQSADDTTRPTMSDPSFFIMYYTDLVESYDEIMKGGNTLYKDLLGEIPLILSIDSENNMVRGNLSQIIERFKRAYSGYYTVYGSQLGVEQFESLWNDYLGLFDIMDKYDYVLADALEDTEFRDGVAGVLEQFISLPTSGQIGFMLSVDQKYKRLSYDFSDGNLAPSRFWNYVSAYYKDVLSAEGYSVFIKLMQATESYARRNMVDDPTVEISSFLSFYKAANTSYTGLQAEDKTAIEFLYNKCKSIADLYDADGKFNVDPASLTSKDNSLLSRVATGVYNLHYVNAFPASRPNFNPYSAYFAAYEATYKAVQDLLSEGSEDLKNLYYYGYVSIDHMTGVFNLDQMVMFNLRVFYNAYMQSDSTLVMHNGVATHLDEVYYENQSVRDFLAESWDIIGICLNYYDGVYGFDENPDIDESDIMDFTAVKSIIDAFDALSEDEKVLMLYIDNGSTLYFNGLQAYFTFKLGWSLVTADLETSPLYYLFGLERNLILFKDELAKESFNYGVGIDSINVMYENLTKGYEALGEKQTEFDTVCEGYLKTLYDSLCSEYNTVKAEYETYLQSHSQS